MDFAYLDTGHRGFGGASMIRQVIDDMASCGIIPTAPGVIQFDLPEMTRFHVAGDKKGTLNGFWRGFSDGLPAGVFGSWKTGAQHNWCAKSVDRMTETELAEVKRAVEAIRAQRAEEMAQAQGEVAKAATERYNALPDASPDQGYCLKKRIQPLNAKQQNTFLVLAIKDWSGAIHSLQTITPSGKKMMLKGGAKRGHHILIKSNPAGRLLICEGFSTGCSLASMYPDDEIVAAVDAYNMQPVARAARERFPDREIVMAADNDPVGIKCANRAARQINGLLLIPPVIGQDWNDWLNAQEVSQ
ncbi:toprim domain-containing protein [Acidithiobacillus albertensis]|uniref:toprim domain-containing protein n=1 Tax=Acidithiobacillus albertensis TaxID=119978 RepID=UPI001C069EB7|nr:toprim domain-containing protein [Acidithiobacillus albertensis]MBU2743361.1 hypothetical protein [Acidithiobacillus albertensis]